MVPKTVNQGVKSNELINKQLERMYIPFFYFASGRTCVVGVHILCGFLLNLILPYKIDMVLLLSQIISLLILIVLLGILISMSGAFHRTQDYDNPTSRIKAVTQNLSRLVTLVRSPPQHACMNEPQNRIVTDLFCSTWIFGSWNLSVFWPVEVSFTNECVEFYAFQYHNTILLTWRESSPCASLCIWLVRRKTTRVICSWRRNW